MAGLLSRIFRPLLKAAEGEVRPGPYYLPVTGGWLPAGAPWNWWQDGTIPSTGFDSSAMVEACLSAYSQTVAMCPGSHWRLNDKDGRDRVTTSALSRIVQSPNSYQSPSDFMLNLTRSLYAEGNGYALALRNDRYEIEELHLMDPRMSYPQVAENGDVFYVLGGNSVIDKQVHEQLIVPQRDVLHVRLHATKRRYPYPLVGDTPLGAAMQDAMLSNAMTAQQINFYMNQARPSFLLGTDLILDKDQVQFIRDRWDEQSKGLKAGGTPILTGGLKPFPISTSSKDAELADIMKQSEQRIALAFRVPLQILGIGGTPFGSTELLMQSWIASGLGFCAQPDRGRLRIAVQAQGPARRICRVRHQGIAAQRVQGADRGAGAGGAGRHHGSQRSPRRGESVGREIRRRAARTATGGAVECGSGNPGDTGASGSTTSSGPAAEAATEAARGETHFGEGLQRCRCFRTPKHPRSCRPS